MNPLELIRQPHEWILDSPALWSSEDSDRTNSRSSNLNIEEWAFIGSWKCSGYFLPLKGSVSVIAPPHTQQTLTGSAEPVDQSVTCTVHLLVHQPAVTTQRHIHLKVDSVLYLCDVFLVGVSLKGTILKLLF